MLLDEARRERDLVRSTCLDDRLTQVNVSLRAAHSRLRALEDAIDGNDEARRNHEHAILVVINQRWAQLQLEAESCAGVETFDTGRRTDVRVWVVGVPDRDPTQFDDDHTAFDPR